MIHYAQTSLIDLPCSRNRRESNVRNFLLLHSLAIHLKNIICKNIDKAQQLKKCKYEEMREAAGAFDFL
ncbi:MAG: hypothetical protein C4560_05775 [Nitrospiraceae bacterium]|nr:MAG: hypothetical protein C4560_05775 [Nitrospiraceae bacterium]